MPSSDSSSAPDPPAPRRLFLAIDGPPPIARALLALMQPAAGFTWTPPARLHLTLRFLGDTPADRIEPLCRRLRVLRVAPFLLPVEGLGVFPPRGRPRVLWCGVGAGHPHLHQLRGQVDAAILALGLGADLRHFTPHFTLARLGQSVSEQRVAQWYHAHREFAGPPFLVESFKLYASELQSDGAQHTLLAEFPLSRDESGLT